MQRGKKTSTEDPELNEDESAEASNLQELAVCLRGSQLIAHELHNIVHGPEFFADHKFLGNLYAEYEDAYDAVVERAIGLGEAIDIAKVTNDAVAKYNSDRSEEDWVAVILALEEDIREDVDECMKMGYSNGTQNFLQGIADESEKRTYKLNQRHG
jgi:DNA-binding ferritin-like protein